MRFRLLLSASLVLGLFLANLAFIKLGLYNTYRTADDYFHFAGGLLMAFFLLEVYLQTKYFKKRLRDAFFLAVIVFTSTVTVAVFWEFAEFGIDQYTPIRLQMGLYDTMHDLILGSAGASIVASLVLFFRR